MCKSTCRVVKTTRAQQYEPGSEEEDSAPAKITSANNAEDIYVNNEEEAAFRRKRRVRKRPTKITEMKKRKTRMRKTRINMRQRLSQSYLRKEKWARMLTSPPVSHSIPLFLIYIL
jgi:hypothetical protein